MTNRNQALYYQVRRIRDDAKRVYDACHEMYVSGVASRVGWESAFEYKYKGIIEVETLDEDCNDVASFRHRDCEFAIKVPRRVADHSLVADCSYAKNELVPTGAEVLLSTMAEPGYVWLFLTPSWKIMFAPLDDGVYEMILLNRKDGFIQFFTVSFDQPDCDSALWFADIEPNPEMAANDDAA